MTAVPGRVPLVDIHSHLLPGVDDGAREVSDSARVLDAFWTSGVRELCLTPHFALSLTRRPERAERLARFTAAFNALAEAVPAPRIHLWAGAEIMIDEPMSPQHDLSPPLTLGESRTVLVEFQFTATTNAVAGTVRALRARDLVPVIAHPERYACCSPEAVAQWRQDGACIQVDATTAVWGGRGRGDRARALLRHGLADLLAADNHGDERSLGAAYDVIVAAGEGDAAAHLCSVAPGALLRDKRPPFPPAIVLEPPTRKPFLARVRGLLRR